MTSRDTTSPIALIDRSVLPVKIMYGCFAKGSMVLIPGGVKPVESIELGDTVCTTEGGAKVRNFYTGMEYRNLVYNLELESGCLIVNGFIAGISPHRTERIKRLSR